MTPQETEHKYIAAIQSVDEVMGLYRTFLADPTYSKNSSATRNGVALLAELGTAHSILIRQRKQLADVIAHIQKQQRLYR